ncbi:hypothetical protein LIER_01251 [Lithospermum erythrorhizon]|uniref:Uncharacterized protein n=1 Tax=Lithospermum erythrorhizon TaxID=34254 RepID=A0AAV3NKB7_LITER
MKVQLGGKFLQSFPWPYSLSIAFTHCEAIGGNGGWGFVALDHSATFHTMVMTSSLKKSIIQYLVKLLKRREFYRRVKRIGKRISELRRLLFYTSNISIYVIQDIDCSSILQKQSLSGMLNLDDCLWSICGERIIIFTTNHKAKTDPALLCAMEEWYAHSRVIAVLKDSCTSDAKVTEKVTEVMLMIFLFKEL